MENGVYSKTPVDLSKWEIKKFTPHLFDSSLYGHFGCGYSTLGLLTGISPVELRKKNKQSNHCSDEYMLKILKKNGFKILPLTKCLVSNTKAELLDNKIQPYHIILSSQLYKKNECSWTVTGFSMLYHNFLIYPLKELEFINRPILTAYLLQHSSYN